MESLLLIVGVIGFFGIWAAVAISNENAELNSFKSKHKEELNDLKSKYDDTSELFGSNNVTVCRKCSGMYFQFWNFYQQDFVDVRCYDCRTVVKQIYFGNYPELRTIVNKLIEWAAKMQNPETSGIIRGFLSDEVFNINKYAFNELRTGQPLIRGLKFVACSYHNLYNDENQIDFDNNEEKRSRRISQKVKDQVWRRDEGKCVECGSNENLEFDHIIPFSKGGANTYRNIQLLCESCNRSKSAKIG